MWKVFSYVDQDTGWQLVAKLATVANETTAATSIYNTLVAQGAQLTRIKVEKVPADPPVGIYPPV